MSLEADLIEVRKLTKMFAGIANVEAVLSGALGAEAAAKAAEKRKAEAEAATAAEKVALGNAKTDVAAAKKQSQEVLAVAKGKAVEVVTKADAEAKALVEAAKAKAAGIVDAAVKEQIAAQAAVDLAKAEKARLDADVSAANTKLTEIRAAIAAVVGK